MADKLLQGVYFSPDDPRTRKVLENAFRNPWNEDGTLRQESRTLDELFGPDLSTEHVAVLGED